MSQFPLRLVLVLMVLGAGCGPAQQAARPDAPVSTPETAPMSTPSAPASAPASTPAEFWDGMYSGEEYIYGTEPNKFFAQHLSALPPGAVLLPAEGEGRNAVWAAEQGWTVSAFDISAVGQRKAHALAKARGVEIDYVIADFADPGLAPESFDAIGLVYAHVPPDVRAKGLEHLKAALKPGGTVILEGFCPEHLAVGSPFGPKTKAPMYAEDELRETFAGYELVILKTEEIALDEGKHDGRGVVVRMVARKPKP